MPHASLNACALVWARSILSPVMSYRNLSSLQYVSTAGVLGFLYTAAAIMIEGSKVRIVLCPTTPAMVRPCAPFEAFGIGQEHLAVNQCVLVCPVVHLRRGLLNESTTLE